MASVGDISVSIGLDISELQRNLQRVESELGNLRDGFRESQRQVDDSTGKMGKALGGLMSSFGGTELLKGLGGAVGEILNSTADLQSMDSQYTQVLGKMKAQSDKYLTEMATKWNKHPNELKNSFMQYNALLKSKGVSEEDAYKLSQDYLQRTVDASAFANEDMATTTDRFMAGIKGEYDSLDTAMVNLSATMLDTKAQEQYGKKFAELTVTQQETLKTQEALRQHTSAGVFGQGSREADSYQNNVENLKATFEELKASLGSPIIESVSGVMKSLGGTLKSVADWFGKLPKPAQEFAVVVTIMTIATIGLALALGGVVIMLGMIAAEIGIGIGALAGIVAGVIAVVAVLVAVVYLVIKYWDEIKAWTISTWTSIVEWLKSAWATIASKASEIWNNVVKAISDAISGVGKWIADTWNSIVDTTVSVFNTIISALASFGLMLYQASGMEAFVNTVIAVWNFLSTTISLTCQMIIAIIGAIWSKLVEVVSPYLTALWNFIVSVWNQIVSVTTSAFTSVQNFFISIWSAIVSFLTPILTSIGSFISNTWNNISTTTSNIFNSVKNTISSIWNSVWTTITGIANNIWNTVTSVFGKVKSAMTQPIEDAKNTISGMLDKIKGFFTSLVLKIPAPKMPSISVSKGTGHFLGQEIPYPKFDISWNAQGQLFTGASVVGNQGFGEAGNEVAIPIERKRYMKPWANMVSDLLAEKQPQETGGVMNNFSIAQLVVREEADVQRIAKELERIQKQQARAKGFA